MGGGNSSCITVVNNPNKRTYIEGERLSLNGMQVKYFTSNKVPELIENYITYPSKDSILSREDNTVIVQYTSLDGDIFKTALSINVKYPVRIEVIYLPKSAYKRNDVVDITGIIAEVVYNDDSRERISESQLTTTPAIGSPVEDNKVIIFSYTHNNIEYKYYYELDNSKLGFDESIITTFASGTWEQIKQMIEASKLGKFDMQDYWKVGDVRSKDVNGTTFGDDLVVLDFNKKKSEYNNSNTVIIGNKSVSKTGSCRSIYNNTNSGCYWRYSPYLGDNYEYFNNIIKNSSLSNIVLKNVNAQVSKIFDMTPNIVVESSLQRYPNGKFPISVVDKKYTDTYLRIPTNNDMVGDNAFEYYKISSNRVKYNASNTPVKYVLDNVSNTHSWNYWALSSYSDNNWSSYISKNNYYECPMPVITFGCIDTNGEYINYDVPHDRMILLDQIYYTYYFAIG